MHRLTRTGISAAALALVGVVGLSACDSQDGQGQQADSKVQQDNYNKLVADSPAHTMTYSPTRNTINDWIDTWSKPGKLSYVYLQNADGKITGYYVLKGLPVSYCTSLTPNYRFVDPGGSGDHPNTTVPAPGIDGAYYSGSECNSYYGFDATTGAYIEYTAGLGINVLLYDQPLPPQKVGDAVALGPTDEADIKSSN